MIFSSALFHFMSDPCSYSKEDYNQSIEYLYNLQVFGSKLGLTNIKKLCSMYNSPEKKLSFIHVAGTNGKGSVCAMLESIYRQAGYKTGLFTSPHLIYFGERIQINGIPIKQETIISLIKRIKPVLAQFPKESHPTFFEVITLMGFLYFAEQQCDIVILETGLGGRLDSTNIITPQVSLITNIDLEHQQYLGNTLSLIAKEKAGIIKHKVPIITAETKPEPLAVIRQIASEKEAPFYESNYQDNSFIPAIDTLSSLTKVPYQRQNIGLVLKTVTVLQKKFPVDKTSISKGLSLVKWPGRFQIFTLGHQTFIIDGAHNLSGFKALTNSLKTRFSQKPFTIIGVLADKNWSDICSQLIPYSSGFITIPVQSPRTLPAETLANELKKQAPAKMNISAEKTLPKALSKIKQEPLILICGSLYLIGESLKYLQENLLSPHPLEQKLNDWKMISS